MLKNIMLKNIIGKEAHEFKIYPLAGIQNVDGFRFIGIDKEGGQHYCIVRRGDEGIFYMASNTTIFQNLVGWHPDITDKRGKEVENYILNKYPDLL